MLVTALMFAAAAPAAAQDEAWLRTTAEFTAATYTAADTDVRFVVTVENVGSAPVADVNVTVRTELRFDAADLGPLAPGGEPLSLAPGASFRVEVPVRMPAPTDLLRVELVFSDGSARTVEAPVTPAPGTASGTVSGLVYGDLDYDEVVDPGEELAGGTIRMNGGGLMREARMDQRGAFTFSDVPVGDYYVVAYLPMSWRVVTPPQLRVEAGVTTYVVRAVRSTQPPLTVSATLDRDTYAVGDLAHEHVVLTNTGAKPMSGIVAACGGPGSRALQGSGWGELYDRPGATLAPGETRTYDFTEVVPEISGVYGFVYLDCAFEVGRVPAVSTTDKAMVPGLRGTIVGALRQPTGAPVPAVTMLLVDDTGHVAARGTSSAAGTFRFADVPANLYEVRLLGPWRHATEIVVYRQVYGGRTEEVSLEVIPGPVVADPEALPVAPVATATPPRPQAVRRPANLADTGASVGELSALALLLLLAGGALTVVGRRNFVR